MKEKSMTYSREGVGGPGTQGQKPDVARKAEWAERRRVAVPGICPGQTSWDTESLYRQITESGHRLALADPRSPPLNMVQPGKPEARAVCSGVRSFLPRPQRGELLFPEQVDTYPL